MSEANPAVAILARLDTVADELACCEKRVAELLDNRAELFAQLRAEGWTFKRIAEAAGLTDAAIVKALRRIAT